MVISKTILFVNTMLKSHFDKKGAALKTKFISNINWFYFIYRFKCKKFVE